MKILFAADIFPPESGGPATYVVTLANELKKLNEEVCIVSLNPDSDVSVVSPPVFAVSHTNKLWRYLQYTWLLFQHSKDVDVIYAMGPVNAGLPALLVSFLRRKRFFVKVVGDYAWEQGTQRFGVTDLINEFQHKKYNFSVELLRLIQIFVARHAYRVIVPSIYLKKIVTGWGVEERKIEPVYNAVPFENATKLFKDSKEKWVVFVGRLVPWKGVDTLIHVFTNIVTKIPEAKLKIVGDGPEMKNLVEQIHKLRLEQSVQLVGNIPHEQALQYIASADLFVLNSAYEGMSHVLLEAMHAEVPVLASHCGGNTEVVAGWGRGELFLYNNQEQLEEKILKFLRGELVLNEWLPEEKQEFLELYSESVMVGRTLKLFGVPKVLMISLDHRLYDVESNVARRVLSSMANGEIFILIPGVEDGYKRPHPRLHVFGRGGSQVRQFFSLWWLARRLNRQEKFAFITVQDPFFTGLLGILIRKRTQEMVVQSHGDFYSTEYYKKSGGENRLRYYLGLIVLYFAPQIRVVSERVRQSFLKRGFSEKKLLLQPVKVDTEGIQKSEANFDVHRKYIGKEKVFVFMGRFEPVKNLIWLIDVFADVVAKHPEWMLLLVGEGSERQALLEKIHSRGLERSVVLESWTSDPTSYLKTADALLFPSLSEGYGMVVVEAVAAGCPIIMNDVGVANYEVQHSETIKIIPVEKRDEWVQAIENIQK